MNVLPLIPENDPRLHQVCEPVAQVDGDIFILAQNMLTTMYASNGIGLAAPQVGRNIRMLVMDCSDDRKQPMVLINPVILSREGEMEVQEGCLSFPGKAYKVKRAARVHGQAMMLDGKIQNFTANFVWAICLQHEIDHLDGITFDQKGEQV